MQECTLRITKCLKYLRQKFFSYKVLENIKITEKASEILMIHGLIKSFVIFLRRKNVDM